MIFYFYRAELTPKNHETRIIDKTMNQDDEKKLSEVVKINTKSKLNNKPNSQPTGQELAIVRTELANDRTFLAIVRTSISFLALALALYKLFDDVASNYFAVAVTITATIVLILGIYSYQKTRNYIKGKQD